MQDGIGPSAVVRGQLKNHGIAIDFSVRRGAIQVASAVRDQRGIRSGAVASEIMHDGLCPARSILGQLKNRAIVGVPTGKGGPIEIASLIGKQAAEGLLAIVAVAEAMDERLRPAAGRRRQLKSCTPVVIVGAAIACGAVEITRGVERQLALGEVAVGGLLEAVENFLRPLAEYRGWPG